MAADAMRANVGQLLKGIDRYCFSLVVMFLVVSVHKGHDEGPM